MPAAAGAAAGEAVVVVSTAAGSAAMLALKEVRPPILIIIDLLSCLFAIREGPAAAGCYIRYLHYFKFMSGFPPPALELQPAEEPSKPAQYSPS